MFPVSNAYKNAIYAPSRTTKGRVTFDLSDVTASGDVSSITATSEFAVSDRTQINDDKRQNTYNYITWENDRTTLDGSFCFADDTLANNGQVGWCSNILSAVDGTLTPNQTLTINFGTTHSSIGITIFFDVLNEEYAADFDVIAYNSGGTPFLTVNVVGNTDTIAIVEGDFLNYKKIDIVVKKWCVAYHRARICEVDFGIVKVYTDNELIDMNLIEEVDLTTTSIPSPELKFTLDNSSRLFNILNPSGYYRYLQQRQKIISEIGLDVGGSYEYVKLGDYLLMEWASDEGSLTASFTARTIIDLLNNFKYSNAVAKVAYSLKQFLIDIFTLCGITSYEIDNALASITTNALCEEATCKDIVQMIAIAGCANVYISRGNSKIIVKQTPTISTAADTIDMDNMYNEAQIELQPIIKSAEVTYWTDLSTSVKVTVANGSITNGSVLTLDKNTFINTNARATAVGNWLITNSNYRSKYTINWRGNPAHELIDVIDIENSYGSNMKAFITKNDIKYQGFLTAKTEGKGGTN